MNKDIKTRLAELNIELKSLQVSSTYRSEEGFDPEYGEVSSNCRAIQKSDPLSEALLSRRRNKNQKSATRCA